MADLQALKEKAMKAKEAREELLKNEKIANDAIGSESEETLEEDTSADTPETEEDTSADNPKTKEDSADTPETEEDTSADTPETEETSTDEVNTDSTYVNVMKYAKSFFSGFNIKSSKEEYLEKVKRMFDSTSDNDGESEFEGDNGFSSNNENPYSGQFSDLGTCDINSDI